MMTELVATKLGHRFIAKVSISESGCWEWTGSRTPDGYGKYWLGRATGNRLVRAHRHSYESLVASIPEGLVLDHLCRNHSCVNPDHLEPVTHRTNILRGTGASAANAARTHCKRGHEFTSENTRRGTNSRGTPTRVCRECENAAQRRRNAMKPKTPKVRVQGTVCRNGHPYDPAAPVWADGSRCVPCRQERAHRAYLRRFE